MTGFFVSNSLGTFHSKKAETIRPKVFTAETSGTGLSQITASDTFKEIWASQAKSEQVFNRNQTRAYRCNTGAAGYQVPTGSSYNANQAFQNYSSISNDKISLYDDCGMSADGSKKLIGAIKIQPKYGVKITMNILVSDCSKMFDYMKSGGGTKIRDAYPWGEHQPNAVGSSYFNPSWDTGKNRAVRITLDGDKYDYIEIDMDGGAMSSKNFSCQVDGVYYGTSKQPDDECSNAVRIDISFKGAAALAVNGCKDQNANNYNSAATQDDGSCLYTTSAITKFEVTPNEVKTGENINISWNLANSNFSSIKCLMNGTDIMPSGKRSSKSQNFNYVPTSEGTKNFELVVNWNKAGTSGDVKSSKKSANVVTAVSYLECTDPNRNTDGNGECASCKSGYYLGSDGLCTKCSDPNRKYDTDGRCGDCESGYSLGTDGLCQKSGCMDEDDANYDPDAVIDDSSACYGDDGDDDPLDIDCELSDWSDWSAWSDPDTDSGTRTRTRTVVTAASGNGAVCEHLEEEETKDPDTGEITITTLGGGTTPAKKEEEESPNLLVPILLGGAILGGVLLLRK
jgi:hypothetical protein